MIESDFFFGPDGVLPSGQDLLEIIRTECLTRLPGQSPWAPPVAPVDAVLAEIATVAPALRSSNRLQDKADKVEAALVRCAREASTELALRILLHTIANNHLPVTRDQYDRLWRLGEPLGYDEFLVGDIEFLIE